MVNLKDRRAVSAVAILISCHKISDQSWRNHSPPVPKKRKQGTGSSTGSGNKSTNKSNLSSKALFCKKENTPGSCSLGLNRRISLFRALRALVLFWKLFGVRFESDGRGKVNFISGLFSIYFLPVFLVLPCRQIRQGLCPEKLKMQPKQNIANWTERVLQHR